MAANDHNNATHYLEQEEEVLDDQSEYLTFDEDDVLDEEGFDDILRIFIRNHHDDNLEDEFEDDYEDYEDDDDDDDDEEEFSEDYGEEYDIDEDEEGFDDNDTELIPMVTSPGVLPPGPSTSSQEPPVIGENGSQIDGLFCPICLEAWSNGGDHQVCCLPCGHIYGLSCIKRWLKQHRSTGKCPQCNRKCMSKEVRVLYASQIVVADEESQKKVQYLEAKCDALEEENADWRKREMKWQKVEDDLLLLVRELNERLRFLVESQQTEIDTQCSEMAYLKARQAEHERTIYHILAEKGFHLSSPPTLWLDISNKFLFQLVAFCYV